MNAENIAMLETCNDLIYEGYAKGIQDALGVLTCLLVQSGALDADRFAGVLERTAQAHEKDQFSFMIQSYLGKIALSAKTMPSDSAQATTDHLKLVWDADRQQPLVPDHE